MSETILALIPQRKVNVRELNLRVNLTRLDTEFEFRDSCKLPVGDDGNRSVFVL